MTVEIGEDAVALANRMIKVLFEEHNAVLQQQAIELLMAGHAIRNGQREEIFVLDSMNKHAKQLLKAMRTVDHAKQLMERAK